MRVEKLSAHGKLDTYGLLVHSTGNGVPQRAIDKNEDPFETGIKVYKNMDASNGVGPHYMICPKGQIVKFREPTLIAWHAGTSVWEREQFMTGNWETTNRVPRETVNDWRRRWPKVKSPQHLFPAKSPNLSYVGVELIPCGVYKKGVHWESKFGEPVGEFGRYTDEQYETLAKLFVDLAAQFKWPKKCRRTGRLVGHEDVNPISRPGWDPGAFRDWFDWNHLYGKIEGLWK